jgi:hypothetical protein
VNAARPKHGSRWHDPHLFNLSLRAWISIHSRIPAFPPQFSTKPNDDEIKAENRAPVGIVKYPGRPNIKIMMIAALPREALRASRIHAGF